MRESGKKKTIKIISAVLAAALIIAGAFGGYLFYRFNCDKSNAADGYAAVYSDGLSAKLLTDGNGIFRVLKINDTHFINGTCENDRHTLDDLKAILDRTPCDLIIVDGDLVEGFNLNAKYDKFGAIDIFARLIEQYEIPWTFAPGNNDSEFDGSNESIISFMMRYGHFLYGNEKNIDGSMQFMIDIYHNENLTHRIAVMDSGMRKPKAIGPYQPISENQANWLNEEVLSENVKTSVFFHMPTNAFQNAYDSGEPYDGIDMYEADPYDGIKGDGVFDEVIKENANITLISCAHQHSNNMCSFYNGRYYQLSSVSGYGAGRDDYIELSCTLTVINTLDENAKTMYSFEQIKA